MYFIRGKMNFGSHYITNDALRASKLLGIELQFWLDLIETLKRYNKEGKVLFRARREEGEWCLQDTVFNSEKTYRIYFKEVDGQRIEDAIVSNGYKFEKIEKEIDNLEDVIYDRPLSESYIQFITPEYKHLLAANRDL